MLMFVLCNEDDVDVRALGRVDAYCVVSLVTQQADRKWHSVGAWTTPGGPAT